MLDITKIFDGTEIYQMQCLWESLDENSDGTITLDELERALKTAGSLSTGDIEKSYPFVVLTTVQLQDGHG